MDHESKREAANKKETQIWSQRSQTRPLTPKVGSLCNSLPLHRRNLLVVSLDLHQQILAQLLRRGGLLLLKVYFKCRVLGIERFKLIQK